MVNVAAVKAPLKIMSASSSVAVMSNVSESVTAPPKVAPSDNVIVKLARSLTAPVTEIVDAPPEFKIKVSSAPSAVPTTSSKVILPVVTVADCKVTVRPSSIVVLSETVIPASASTLAAKLASSATVKDSTSAAPSKFKLPTAIAKVSLAPPVTVLANCTLAPVNVRLPL